MVSRIETKVGIRVKTVLDYWATQAAAQKAHQEELSSA